MDYETVREVDPVVADALAGERERQNDTLDMIASENHVSEAVMAAQSSELTNKYAEGYPGERYYGGCEHANEVERLAIERATELWGAEHVNVQPHSGSQANMSVYFAMLDPGDRILSLDLTHGGHLSHGHPANFAGKLYEVEQYEIDPETGYVDYDGLAETARGFDPDIIVSGYSAYPRQVDWDRVQSVADAVDPDVVVDTVAYHPAEVEEAVDVFCDVDAYLYVSSVAAYDPEHVLKFESDTPLLGCSAEQASDDSFATYGNRKAEGDRIVREAAADGVAAVGVRPSMVYGPHNHLEFVQYWIDRTLDDSRVLVPGDGTFLAHRSYVADVASAVRVVLERGEAGECYNAGDRRPLTIDQTIDLIARVADTDAERVYAGEHDLATEGLSRLDFPLYNPAPYAMSTDSLAALGWEPTPVETAMRRTVDYHRENGLSDHDVGPAREVERRLVDALA